MAEQVALFCFILMWVLIGLSVAAIATTRGRERISDWVDRKAVRPSAIEGSIQIIFGAVMFACASLLPIPPNSLVVIFYTFAAAATFALGVEKLRRAPPIEYRPTWYVGDGDPTWRPKRRWPPVLQFSLGWIVTFTMMLCLTFAVFSIKLDAARIAKRKHELAVQRIKALGGTFQQGTVSLAGSRFKNDELAILADIQGLVDLNLGATDLGNAALKHIAKLSSLQTLNLSGTQVDDTGLAMLSDLQQLSVLRLRQTRVTGTAFPLRRRQQLVGLDLSRCPITKQGLACLRGSTKFYLDLSQTSIDDSMLKEIKALDGVERLFLQETNISDEGARVIVSALGEDRVKI